jgi:amino-acid N-acetyltransferase
MDSMEIRKAKSQDVPAIHALISCYAELDRMLFRSMADIYENLQVFHVAESNGKVVGCCALKVIWADLAEIQSLAVDKSYFGKGLGSALVKACIEQARSLGIGKVFTLTMAPVFFDKIGFKRVDRKTLPMKVWSDCARCPKQDHCDEIALIIELASPHEPLLTGRV